FWSCQLHPIDAGGWIFSRQEAEFNCKGRHLTRADLAFALDYPFQNGSTSVISLRLAAFIIFFF
ncbi:MAG TPA: hypothetical protein DCP31_17870, partial [Cyanobacteria bacterium UBA8543]|nr:hypothetical protein [Cyanobacteria bacterium UBA8543]